MGPTAIIFSLICSVCTPFKDGPRNERVNVGPATQMVDQRYYPLDH